jgi:hypothetical protein
MSFIGGKTTWALLLSSNGNTENRHVQDIAFGLSCLENAGIDPASIRIYIDGSGRHSIEQFVSLGSRNRHTVYNSTDFFADLSRNTNDNLVVFVTGHGNLRGIEGQAPISPHRLITDIKSSPSLKRAVVYLGQCYAGVFNYIGAGNRLTPRSAGPDVVLIGATNLYESISVSTTENLPSGQAQWVANFFLLYVFKWISTPIDVDGDGVSTIIDSFKFAGVASNVQNKKLKIDSFRSSMDLHARLLQAREDVINNPGDITKVLNVTALETLIIKELSVRYTHQEPWILNAIPAQSWEI